MCVDVVVVYSSLLPESVKAPLRRACSSLRKRRRRKRNSRSYSLAASTLLHVEKTARV